jgi:taurine dioxygenase
MSATVAINIRPLSPALGASIEGIDLNKPISAAVRDEIYAAWLKHLILVFPNQGDLTIDSQIAFSKFFGELDSSTFSKKTLPGHPEIYVIGVTKVNGVELGGKVAPAWHSDGQYLETPFKGALLHSKIVPEVGGDTCFTNMYKAYETLPEDMRRRIDGLRVVHSRVKRWSIVFPSWPPLTEEEKVAMPDVIHPLVRTHPETKRKCLYVGGNTGWAIEGMDLEEGRALLDELRAHATSAPFVYRHKWTLGDALLWDNRCTMHLPPDYDPTKVQRLMYRTSILGDRPY